jgi:hypothetical protein
LHLLHLVVHHLIFDAPSVGILAKDLGALYEACLRGEKAPLAPLAFTYGDFARWQRRLEANGAYREQLAYWRKALAGVAELGLPTDKPRPAVQTFSGDVVDFSIPPPVMDGVKKFVAAEGVTLPTLLLAAFQLLLARKFGVPRICVGSPVTYRDRPEWEAVIGMFANTIALNTDLSGVASFRELLARVRKVLVEALLHRDIPFEQVVDALSLPRDLSRSPVFQTLFAFQHREGGGLGVAGSTITLVETKTRTAKFDLSLYIDEEGAARLEYNTDLYFESTIVDLREKLRELLRQLSEGKLPEMVKQCGVVNAPSGNKINRDTPKPLPAPAGPEKTRATRPGTEMENTIETIWKSVLGRARIGREQRFFDLGGNSLLLTKVQLQMERALGKSVPMVELFRYPTISGLAAFLEKARAPQVAGPSPGETVRRFAGSLTGNRRRLLRVNLENPLTEET